MGVIHWIYWVSKKYSRYGLNKYVKDSCKNISEEGEKVLFIGSGGPLETLVKSNLPESSKIITIDFDELRQPDIVMDATNLEFEDNSFDYVFLLEVLEHIPEPTKALSEIHRCLKVGGKLFMSTPFVFGIHDAPHDYFRFTKYGLKYLTRNFKTVTIAERNSYIFSVCVLLIRLIVSRKILDKLIGFIFLTVSSVLLPLIFILSLVIRSNQITTGYNTTCIKGS